MDNHTNAAYKNTYKNTYKNISNAQRKESKKNKKIKKDKFERAFDKGRLSMKMRRTSMVAATALAAKGKGDAARSLSVLGQLSANAVAASSARDYWSS